MEIFTVLGLIIFLFGVMFILSVLVNISFFNNDEEILNCLGFIFTLIVLSIVLSLFFTRPEKFGYEKIVSNNSVEQEVKE